MLQICDFRPWSPFMIRASSLAKRFSSSVSLQMLPCIWAGCHLVCRELHPSMSQAAKSDEKKLSSEKTHKASYAAREQILPVPSNFVRRSDRFSVEVVFARLSIRRTAIVCSLLAGEAPGRAENADVRKVTGHSRRVDAVAKAARTTASRQPPSRSVRRVLMRSC